MADIILKNSNGTPIVYNGINKINVPSADGGMVTFSEGSGGTTIEEVDVLQEAKAEDVGKVVKLISNKAYYECIPNYVLKIYTPELIVDSTLLIGQIPLKIIENENDININEPDYLYILSDGTNAWFIDSGEIIPFTFLLQNMFEMEFRMAGIVDELPPLTENNVGDIHLQSEYSYYSYGLDDFLLGMSKDIVIPSNLIDIPPQKFAHQLNVTHINIPSTVINIGDRGFYNCSCVSVKILSKEINIMNEVFMLCYALETVDLTSVTSVPTLGIRVFDRCDNLQQILVPSALVNDFKSAEGWSAYADKIVGV